MERKKIRLRTTLKISWYFHFCHMNINTSNVSWIMIAYRPYLWQCFILFIDVNKVLCCIPLYYEFLCVSKNFHWCSAPLLFYILIYNLSYNQFVSELSPKSCIHIARFVTILDKNWIGNDLFTIMHCPMNVNI